MAKKTHTIEIKIASLLRNNPGKKMSAGTIANQLGTSENMVNQGLHYIRKNVHIPNEMIVRTGKIGNSKYELLTDTTSYDDVKNKMNGNDRNIRRMFIDITKTAKIANTTRNPVKQAQLNAIVMQKISEITTAMTQAALLQLPVANV